MRRVDRRIKLVMTKRVDGTVMSMMNALKYELYSDVPLAHFHLINHCTALGFDEHILAISTIHTAHVQLYIVSSHEQSSLHFSEHGTYMICEDLERVSVRYIPQ